MCDYKIEFQKETDRISTTNLICVSAETKTHSKIEFGTVLFWRPNIVTVTTLFQRFLFDGSFSCLDDAMLQGTICFYFPFNKIIYI